MDKFKVIEEISDYISANKIEEALNLIVEHESELNGIAEFWNLKSIICIKTKEYSIALNCLNEALEMEPNNIDYLYNLAYLYELRDELYNSYKIYYKLLPMVKDEESRKKIIEYIDNVESQEQEIILKNIDNKCMPNFSESIYTRRANFVDALVDTDAPLVSVCIQGYNNLEKYTKKCVECVLKYTKGIDYELILIDNGSEDGTFEYFKTIKHPRKKIIRVTKNIGAGYGGYQGYLNCNGKYIMLVANDIFVTNNWLSNMLKCALSDERIGMICPASDYIANMQAVDLKYTDFDDMQKKAAEYNISDPRKWEERLRLITLGTLFKKECLDIVGFVDYGYMHDFSDDDIAFRIRRAGYKTIFCKDTFISHAGKITDKGSKTAQESLIIGRKVFNNKNYGIDAWDDVNYEPVMMQCITGNERFNIKNPKVLGIDVACGAPILEIKNKLRNEGEFNTRLSAFSTEAKYWLDLKTICDDEVIVDRIDFLKEHFCGDKFEYIVIGKSVNEYADPYKLISQCLELISDSGQLMVKIKNTYNIITLMKVMGMNVNYKKNNVYHLCIDELNEYLRNKGYYIKDIYTEFHQVNDDFIEELKRLTKFSDDNAFNKALVNNYILNLVRME